MVEVVEPILNVPSGNTALLFFWWLFCFPCFDSVSIAPCNIYPACKNTTYHYYYHYYYYYYYYYCYYFHCCYYDYDYYYYYDYDYYYYYY